MLHNINYLATITKFNSPNNKTDIKKLTISLIFFDFCKCLSLEKNIFDTEYLYTYAFKNSLNLIIVIFLFSFKTMDLYELSVFSIIFTFRVFHLDGPWSLQANNISLSIRPRLLFSNRHQNGL